MKHASVLLAILKQFALAIDQAINCLVYIDGDGWGWADEAFSARVFRCYLQGFISDRPYRAVDMLLFFDPQHCYESWRSEVERKQLPGYYRI